MPTQADRNRAEAWARNEYPNAHDVKALVYAGAVYVEVWTDHARAFTITPPARAVVDLEAVAA